MDGAKEVPLTPALIEHLKRLGYNQSQIATETGVSRQRVSAIVQEFGLFSKTPRDTVKENYPWDTSGGFYRHYIDNRMRDHGEWMATDGNALSEQQRKRLRYFYNSLESNNYVVEFDPNIPPTGGSAVGGFIYRPREDSDGDLIIRVNKYTILTPVGESLWCLPERSMRP